MKKTPIAQIRARRLESEFGPGKGKVSRATEERLYAERESRAPRRRAAGVVSRGASGAAGHVGRFARNPGKYATAPKAENKVGLAVMLFLLVMGAATIRQGHWPNASGMLSIGAGALVIVALSAIAPELVVTVLIVALIIFALTNVNIVLGIVDAAFGKIDQSIGGSPA